LIEIPPQYLYLSENEEDTERLAGQLAALLGPGDVLALDGDLGAGKTRFSQAVARSLGVKGIVNSPTFTLIKEYEGDSMPFYHMDVYRLSPEEAGELGLEEYFDGPGVTLVEWAGLIEELLPPERLDIRIGVQPGGSRVFALTPRGTEFERRCRQLKENGIFDELQS
jgi:tRNA threonylcarbamoyladenosine biosynthesis protein TsaE